ncbi:exodeoxyribonuclease VII large subunit [Olivibacter sitiensis]|uniref:exodeoxyribonuclease VII large subunit n=1 Tax=Olivibacter sitiensis TaxID=376470 RepID=UPI0003FDF087|nr:exodeoxyribonuclease VII large subunit [Olivibacter sitiensis]
MPEIVNNKTVFTLYEVARSVQKTIAERYGSLYWIKAEMNKLNYYKHSGHCYPELLEKRGGRVVSEMRAILWKGDYQQINARFMEMTGEPLKNGISILFQAAISYDPLYGMSLRIVDVDPAFTLGELEREKIETINKLKAEGIYHANKQVPFPLLPKRLAVISVETSKGLADFLKIIGQNPFGYRFQHDLFPALLQGEKAIASIAAQLKEIEKLRAHYDVVAIVRGGGGEVGLSCYNHYALAHAVASFPIPIITGIGHATNETVTEMVAYKNAITPSELADFLIQRFHQYAVPLQRAEERIAIRTKELLLYENRNLERLITSFRNESRYVVQQERRKLDQAKKLLWQQGKFLLASEWKLLEHGSGDMMRNVVWLLKEERVSLGQLEKMVGALSPSGVLKRGFSLTMKNGRAIFDAQDLVLGDDVETSLANGRFLSKVIKKLNTEE